MIDPVKIAKDNNLWPDLGKPAEGKTGEGLNDGWRDEARAKIKKLVKDYGEWAMSEKGVIDDPGPVPKPVELPLRAPDPSATVEEHQKFRRITDEWYDTEFMVRYLPESELWATANGMWQAKLSKQRAEKLSRRRASLGRFRIVGFVIMSMLAGFLTWLALSLVTLPQSLVGGLCGLVAVFAVLGTNYAFNVLEDKAARAEADEAMREERETQQKRDDERRRLLQRLGIPDDTQPPPTQPTGTP